MTSLPSPADDYAAPASMDLTKAAWDATFGSIGARLRALETLDASLQAIIDAGVDAGHQSIADSLAPLVAQYQAEVQILRDQIALAEDQLAAISEAGVVAANVSVSPIDGLNDIQNAQAALAELAARSDALVASVTSEFDTLGTAAFMNAGSAAGELVEVDENGKIPETLVPQFLQEDVFLATATWTKDPRAKFVIIEMVAPGAGGGGGCGTTSSTQSRGARGGGGGEGQIHVIPASSLPDSLLVEIGAFGLGGDAGPPGDNQSGGSGTGGFPSRFGPLTVSSGLGGVGGRKFTSTQSGASSSAESPHNGGRGGFGSAWTTGGGAGFPGSGFGSGGGAGGDSNGNGSADGGAGYFGAGGSSNGGIAQRAGDNFGGGGAGGNTGENGGNGGPSRIRVSQI